MFLKLENMPQSLNPLPSIIKTFINELKPAFVKDNLLGLGLNLLGRIKNNTKQSFSFGLFDEEPLSVKIKKEISILTWIENDCGAISYGEFCNKSNKNVRHVLFKGKAILIKIFNPELLILGGTLSVTADYIRIPIISAINKYSLSLVNIDT